MRSAVVVLGLLLGAARIASAVEPSIAVYKCTSADGRVTYQDYTCKGGVAVDIKPDAANPDAIARLERARMESDRAAAARKAEEAIAIMRRDERLPRAREMEIPIEPADPYFGWPGGGYEPFERSRLRDPRRPDDLQHRRSINSDRRVPATIRRPQRG